MRAPARVDDRRAELQQLRVALLGFLVVTIPLAMGLIVWAPAGGHDDFNRRVTIAPFDIALLMLLAVAIGDRRPLPRWSALRWTARLAVVLGVVLLVAFAFHPSPRGVEFLIRLAGVWAIADAVVRLDGADRRRVFGVLVGVASFEAVIGLAQSAKGGALGIGVLEYRGFFYTFGSSTAGRAGLDHPYHLACFLLVGIAAALVCVRGAARPLPWLAGAGVCAAALATTYSRTGLLSIAAMIGLAAIGPRVARDRAATRRLAAVLVVGFLIGALGFGNGWHARGVQSTGAHQNVDSSRRERAKEALRLVGTQPIVGVGPGEYVNALVDVRHEDLLPAHDVVLHAAAEAGVLAGVLVGALLVGVTWWVIRRGIVTTAVYAALALYFLLDAYTYIFPTGLALTGLWCGLLLVADRREMADA